MAITARGASLSTKGPPKGDPAVSRGPMKRAAHAYSTLFLASAFSLASFAACSNGAGSHSEPQRSTTSAVSGKAPRPPVAMPLRHELPAAPSPCPDFQYLGGQVISAVQIVAVWWEPTGFSVDPLVKAALPNWYTQVTNSAYLDWMGEYSTTIPGGTGQTVGRGTFLSAVSIQPSAANAGTTVDDTQISAELVLQLQANKLPQPTFDAQGYSNTIYMFDFPPGITITLQGSQSCSSFCAYHYTTTYNGKYIPYGVHPDFGPTSACTGANCGTQPTYVLNDESVHSHEMIEAISDEAFGIAINNGCDSGALVCAPAAWFSNTCNEIGDACQNSGDGQVTGPDGMSYVVQLGWSTKYQSCIDQPPIPICTSPNNPPGCRACNAGDNGSACNGTTPMCETRTGNVRLGYCVPCVDNTTCMGTTPICQTTTDPMTDDTCRACVTGECSGANPICSTNGPSKGACIQCDPTTNMGCSGSQPICDSASGTCRACMNGECSGATPVCEQSGILAGTCVQCDSTHTTACTGATPLCNPASLKCIGCQSNADCANSMSGHVCSTMGTNKGSCVACQVSSDCTNPATPMCDPTTNTCVAPMTGNDAGTDSGSTDSGSADSSAPRLD